MFFVTFNRGMATFNGDRCQKPTFSEDQRTAFGGNFQDTDSKLQFQSEAVKKDCAPSLTNASLRICST